MTDTKPYLVISQEDFKRNQAIDVSQYTKQLQGNDYIAWGVQVTLLREFRPSLAVDFEKNAEGHPFFDIGDRGSYLLPFVYDQVTGERTPSIFFPVRNNKKQAAIGATMDNMGNQMQRALSKVIAQMTGIGWTLYSRIDESMLELEELDKTKSPSDRASKVASLKPTSKTKTDDGMDF